MDGSRGRGEKGEGGCGSAGDVTSSDSTLAGAGGNLAPSGVAGCEYGSSTTEAGSSAAVVGSSVRTEDRGDRWWSGGRGESDESTPGSVLCMLIPSSSSSSALSDRTSLWPSVKSPSWNVSWMSPAAVYGRWLSPSGDVAGCKSKSVGSAAEDERKAGRPAGGESSRWKSPPPPPPPGEGEADIPFCR